MPHRFLVDLVRDNRMISAWTLPFGSKCCVLGTLGRSIAHSSLPSATSSFLSRCIFRLDNRDSAPGRFWLLPSLGRGVPTVFTEGFVTFAAPSLGGIGGLEDD